MSLKRGALIVLEGVDRSGKSTQCRKLVETLKSSNIPSELILFPDRTTLTGKLISQYLSNKDTKLHDKAIHLLFAANRWENADKMMNLLKSGVTLIVDRYSFSGIAYSAAKPGMDFEWCKSQELGLPKPDRVFFLHLNPSDMSQRPGFGTERYEKADFQSAVLDNYRMLMDDDWEVINAGESIENVHNALLSRILSTIDACKDRELGKLEFKRRNVKENNQNSMNL